MSEYTNPDALVETDQLAQNLADERIRIIEVDEDVTSYQKGHIPGAVGWDWFRQLHDPVRRDFIDQEGLTALLRQAGVGPETTVVLYGGNSNWFAAYAYWLLKYLGFDRVKLLNGGRQKWELESRELAQDVTSFPATDITVAGPVREEIRAFRDDVLGKLGQAAFVDVRSPEEYRGEKLAPDHLPQEQAQVPGHIPGAANVTWAKSADELRALYVGQGISGDRETVAYCRIGERSSHTWFVLKELLGFGDVKNYDGSWTEYGSLVGVPIER
jgi:thiosulfate/3-mercaptopyruvate sulfurtransferase